MKKLARLFVLLILVSCKTNNNIEKIIKHSGSSLLTQPITVKDEVYQTIYILDTIFRQTNKNIIHSISGNYRIYTKLDIADSPEIMDKDRIVSIEEALDNEELKAVLTNDFYGSILERKNTMSDPECLGLLLFQDEIGKRLVQILSMRDFLNAFFPYIQGDDPSSDMSDSCYIEYHKERIHFTGNNNVAIYKTYCGEMALTVKEKHIAYFKFIPSAESNDTKWLLDGVEICPEEKQEIFDKRLIGESSPLKYFYPYCEE